MIRAAMGSVEKVEVTIYASMGRMVHSGTITDGPAGVSNGEPYYEYVWTGAKATGTYFAVIHGKTADGKTVKARCRFAVVR